MTEAQLKIIENRVRRAADRQGLAIRKNRRRDPRAWDYGLYYVVDPSTSNVVIYQDDEVEGIEKWLGERSFRGAHLHDYGTGETLRPATRDEWVAALADEFTPAHANRPGTIHVSDHVGPVSVY